MEVAKILPARILKYYPETQTADLKICAEKVFSSIEVQEEIREWQEIEQVPVQTCSGGNFALTFPINPGDTCKVSFSQVGYDHWFIKDKDTAGLLYGMPHPHLRRSFHLDDGFCEMGYNTLPRVFNGVSPTDTEWRNRKFTSFVTIREDGSIEINKDGTKIAIEVDNSITILAPTINIFGNINHVGNVNHIGNTIDAGNVLHTGNTVEIGNTTLTGNSVHTGNSLQTGNDVQVGSVVRTGDPIGRFPIVVENGVTYATTETKPLI